MPVEENKTEISTFFLLDTALVDYRVEPFVIRIINIICVPYIHMNVEYGKKIHEDVHLFTYLT